MCFVIDLRWFGAVLSFSDKNVGACQKIICEETGQFRGGSMAGINGKTRSMRFILTLDGLVL